MHWRLNLLLILFALLGAAPASAQQDPPAINPFGKKLNQQREDTYPGCIDLSDGTVQVGKLYLTRDLRLKIYDESLKRQRDVPLRVVESIECKVQKEWLEKEWRFKANADNEKVYTGRSYPARQYTHTITLHDGSKISGPMSGIIYMDPYQGGEKQRFLMHKRQKGELNSRLDELVYVKSIRLGESALREALSRQQDKADDRSSRKR